MQEDNLLAVSNNLGILNNICCFVNKSLLKMKRNYNNSYNLGGLYLKKDQEEGSSESFSAWKSKIFLQF